MTLEKAREILSLSVFGGSTTFDEDYRQAQKKGITCIDYVLKIKRYPHLIDKIPLPGED